MSRVILASTKPLTYQGEQLSKSPASLKKIAKRKSLPLVLEHDGPKVGVVSNLAYEVRSGVGYLMGNISDFMGKVGSSLQYSGVPSQGVITIDSVDHVALVSQPRDLVTVFADSQGAALTYRDSVEDKVEDPKEGETEAGEKAEERGQKGTTEIELTDEVVDQLFDLLFKDPERLAQLVTKIQGTKAKEEDVPKEDVPKKDVPKVEDKRTTTRIIIKPREVLTPETPKTAKSIQRPFKGLL